jgi:hypothetical protein
MRLGDRLGQLWRALLKRRVLSFALFGTTIFGILALVQPPSPSPLVPNPMSGGLGCMVTRSASGEFELVVDSRRYVVTARELWEIVPCPPAPTRAFAFSIPGLGTSSLHIQTSRNIKIWVMSNQQRWRLNFDELSADALSLHGADAAPDALLSFPRHDSADWVNYVGNTGLEVITLVSCHRSHNYCLARSRLAADGPDIEYAFASSALHSWRAIDSGVRHAITARMQP